jgi:hypothetical protein
MAGYHASAVRLLRPTGALCRTMRPIRRASLPLRRRAVRAPLLLCLALVSAGAYASSPGPAPSKTVDDYRHFRIASIDLVGRMPTREEITAFERPDFDWGTWIGAHTQGPGYVERLTRIYMDALRLEPNLNFTAGPSQLYRTQVTGPDGKPVNILYRGGQRRVREATDGEFCLSPDETGLVIRPMAAPIGTAKRVPMKSLDAHTVMVKPWWLYKDYKAPHPHERYQEAWANPDSGFHPVDALLAEPDGKPTTEVRVCREEAQERAEGHLYASGRVKPPGASGASGAPTMAGAKASTAVATTAPLPGGRVKPAPLDVPYVTQHKGSAVECDTKEALSSSVDCGCGVGLERCMPNSGQGDTPAFQFPNHAPLGPGLPLDSANQSAFRWYPYWWSREAVHYLDYLFDQDRDFREVLTGHSTFVNGPLAQFYKTIQRGGCCGPEALFGMRDEAEPLFDPSRVPTDLAPQDTDKWEMVADRGPHAAGILTMPMYLEKYASARARAAAIYSDFLCKSFSAGQAELTPSEEPDLMKRPGCQTCHATLEPLAAYFARIEPASFVYLPESLFPIHHPICKKDKAGKLNGPCTALYDVAFTGLFGPTLRSAYASPAHANAAAVGAGSDISAMPEFAECAVQRVTSSFLGRPTTPDDAPLLASLTQEFVRSGFRMRALVRAIVLADAYRKANDTSEPR